MPWEYEFPWVVKVTVLVVVDPNSPVLVICLTRETRSKGDVICGANFESSGFGSEVWVMCSAWGVGKSSQCHSFDPLILLASSLWVTVFGCSGATSTTAAVSHVFSVCGYKGLGIIDGTCIFSLIGYSNGMSFICNVGIWKITYSGTQIAHDCSEGTAYSISVRVWINSMWICMTLVVCASHVVPQFVSQCIIVTVVIIGCMTSLYHWKCQGLWRGILLLKQICKPASFIVVMMENPHQGNQISPHLVSKRWHIWKDTLVKSQSRKCCVKAGIIRVVYFVLSYQIQFQIYFAFFIRVIGKLNEHIKIRVQGLTLVF